MTPPSELAELPVIFALGPDAGGGRWQVVFFDYLRHHASERNLGQFLLAVPCRYEDDDPVHQYLCPGATKSYAYQLTWERDFIDRAALSYPQGCVAGWLPQESAVAPRNDGQPYARDTRGELGEIRGWMRPERGQGVRFVLGGEKEFPGWEVIVRNFSHATGMLTFPTYGSLNDLARIAVRIAKRRR